MRKLLIVGASGFGRELLEWVADINEAEPTWDVVGFLDDKGAGPLECACDREIVGTIEEWEPAEDEFFALALANPGLKKRIVAHLLSKGARFASIIHPSARIAKTASYGAGLVMYPGSSLGPNDVVGDYVTVLRTHLGHDVSVGDYSTIGSNCDINGHVSIGSGSYIGGNAVCLASIQVGDNAYVGAGSVCIDKVKSSTKVFGNPAVRVDR